MKLIPFTELQTLETDRYGGNRKPGQIVKGTLHRTILIDPALVRGVSPALTGAGGYEARRLNLDEVIECVADDRATLRPVGTRLDYGPNAEHEIVLANPMREVVSRLRDAGLVIDHTDEPYTAHLVNIEREPAKTPKPKPDAKAGGKDGKGGKSKPKTKTKKKAGASNPAKPAEPATPSRDEIIVALRAAGARDPDLAAADVTDYLVLDGGTVADAIARLRDAEPHLFKTPDLRHAADAAPGSPGESTAPPSAASAPSATSAFSSPEPIDVARDFTREAAGASA